MIFGNNLINSGIIFNQYMKDLKLTSLDQYIYTLNNHSVFGNIVFSFNPGRINIIHCNNIHDKYFNKLYSVNSLKEKTNGYETDIGIIENFDSISKFNAIQNFNKIIRIIDSLSNDIINATDIKFIDNLNEDYDFYNNILIRKSAEGVGRCILNNRVIYISPSMLPGSKSTKLDAKMYYTEGKTYFTIEFITHKDTNDISTFMHFLCL